MILNSTTVQPDDATLEMICHNHAVPPQPCCGIQSVIVDDFLYLCGGIGQDNEYFSSVF